MDTLEDSLGSFLTSTGTSFQPVYYRGYPKDQGQVQLLADVCLVSEQVSTGTERTAVGLPEELLFLQKEWNWQKPYFILNELWGSKDDRQEGTAMFQVFC